MPTSGEVVIDGVNLCACRDKQLAKVRREKIGFVFQDFSLLDELSVRENIALSMLLAGKKPKQDYLEKLMRRLGTLERRDHTPTQLSGGILTHDIHVAEGADYILEMEDGLINR